MRDDGGSAVADSVVAGTVAVESAAGVASDSESKTARPQAGTGRYHLPFNEADETGKVFYWITSGVAGVEEETRLATELVWREFELAVFVSSTSGPGERNLHWKKEACGQPSNHFFFARPSYALALSSFSCSPPYKGES